MGHSTLVTRFAGLIAMQSLMIATTTALAATAIAAESAKVKATSKPMSQSLDASTSIAVSASASKAPSATAQARNTRVPSAVAEMARRMAEGGGGMKVAIEKLAGSSVWAIGLSRDGLTQVFYTDDTGSVLLVGMAVLLPDKVSASKRFVEKHFPGTKDLAEVATGGEQVGNALRTDKVNLTDEQTIAALRDVATRDVGAISATRRVYAFVDANCQYCQNLHKAVVAELARPNRGLLSSINWRWVPIEIDTDNTESWVNAAVALDPSLSDDIAMAKFFQQNSSNVDPSKLSTLLKKNGVATASLQVDATPTFFITSADGAGNTKIRRVNGFNSLVALLKAD